MQRCIFATYSKEERKRIDLEVMQREAGCTEIFSRPRKPYKGKSIAELNREAVAMGMTYGKYIEYLENQKGQTNGKKYHKNN